MTKSHKGIKALAIGFTLLFSGLSLSYAQSVFDNDRRIDDRRFEDRRFDNQRQNRTQNNNANQEVLTPRQRQCIALERQLARHWVNRSRPANAMAKIDEEIRKWDTELDKAEIRAERHDCYDEILFFGRELKRTPRCLKLNRQIEEAKRKIDQLNSEKSAFRRQRDPYEKNQIISQLARLGCGDQYVREDNRRNDFSFFGFSRDSDYQQDFDREQKPDNALSSKILPYATYRTMCVRQCDGFYYPISFSTLPSRFPQDANACQSKCAAPASLYVYKNPGEEIEQMISLTGKPYSELPNAFRFRKEFVKGCSCKVSEYKPNLFSSDTNQTEKESSSNQSFKTNKNQNMSQSQSQQSPNLQKPASEQKPTKKAPSPKFNPFN